MRLRQRVNLPRFLDGKPSRTITSLEILKPINRDTRCSCGELQETGLLFRIPAADDLPEVLNHLILFLVSSVIGVFFPVLHIDIRDTTNQKLQFTLIKDIDQLRGDKLVEPCNEGIELLLHALLNLPFRDQSDLESAIEADIREIFALTQHIASCFRLSQEYLFHLESGQRCCAHQTAHRRLRR
jgi:hypothetical protein